MIASANHHFCLVAKWTTFHRLINPTPPLTVSFSVYGSVTEASEGGGGVGCNGDEAGVDGVGNHHAPPTSSHQPHDHRYLQTPSSTDVIPSFNHKRRHHRYCIQALNNVKTSKP
ncbi:unnamed protein product [Lactuca virosa]|uniref:Uncharacterized protein n=1 Tax=Lactuca virosa TaxID=75947 RepID=A0AAU9MGP5_9ASTR|nr:unnamed protein product [Lactuca virosa]